MQGDLHALPMSFYELPNRPPAHRNVIVYGTSSTMPKNCDQQVLSLNLPYISISPNTNLEQTKGITEATNTPNTNLNSEPLPLSTWPPTYRNNKVYEVSTTVQCKIDAGLSLDLSNLFQTSNNRLDYAEKITGDLNTPNKKKNDPESPTITNSTPNTRNGGVRKGIFDKNHNFRRFRS